MIKTKTLIMFRYTISNNTIKFLYYICNLKLCIYAIYTIYCMFHECTIIYNIFLFIRILLQSRSQVYWSTDQMWLWYIYISSYKSMQINCKLTLFVLKRICTKYMFFLQLCIENNCKAHILYLIKLYIVIYLLLIYWIQIFLS